ncbi:MAG: malate synthase A [Thalassospira sp.]|nr:malate synthase A [Thalassospira sp.]
MLNAANSSIAPRVRINAAIPDVSKHIVSSAALDFLLALHDAFNARRVALLAARAEKQTQLNNGALPDFLPETQHIRDDASWRVAPIPADLQNRRVEITGPVDRKMVINALNSGANCFMADFEDSSSPTFANMAEGQANLFDAVRRTIAFTDTASGKAYKLKDTLATLIVRPRGWHLEERHITVDGTPMSGSLVDFGLFFFHNAKEQLNRGTAPYFYLPKLELYKEAELWNDVFVFAQKHLGIPNGTIKATVLIETILATFQLDEILFALKDHIAGLNCGRWDYIFSYIKKLQAHKDRILPDRTQVLMTTPFLRGYSQLVIHTCHKRGAFAMGGMAAQIPIKDNAAANDEAMARVKADKEREAGDGHDGTWVAHPALVPLAREVFDRLMPGANNLHKSPDISAINQTVLLSVPPGAITEGGLRTNVRVSLHYLAAWLNGQGCVPIHNLMEDAATAEISRTQVWQWLKHKAQLADGRTVTQDLVEDIIINEATTLKNGGTLGTAGVKLSAAVELFKKITLMPDLYDFLTLPAYAELG